MKEIEVMRLVCQDKYGKTLVQVNCDRDDTWIILLVRISEQRCRDNMLLYRERLKGSTGHMVYLRKQRPRTEVCGFKG